MFKKAPALPPDRDFTLNLRETSFYRYGHLRTLGLTGEVTAIAVDPVLSLFGVGTSSGQAHVYGQAAFQFTLPVEVGKACAPIRFLLFHPGHHRLVVIDESNTLHTFSLSHISEHANPLTHPPLPVKEGSYTLWGTITAVELPLPSYTHLFLTMKDGTTLSWDLSRRMLGNWKIGNCWLEHEQRMIRSGVPGKRSNAQHPMATCIAMNPRDLNIILIGYEGGVVAWNVQKAAVDKTFEMTLPPGAPGGGTYLDQDSLWTERSPTVTTIAWRPDGLTFAVGHSDGCMTFWAYADADKPLMVRTITHEDVNVTDADELFSAGALDTQIRSKRDPSGAVSAVAANREPIFKLAWASFPDQPSLKALIAAQGTEAAGEPLSNATVDYAERGETLLLVLGGQSPGEKPGINILQFPAYVPPVPQAKPKGMMTHSEGLSVQDRYAYRDSLAPTGTSNFVTRTPPEDFVLLPRSSPYFALSHDPIALIISLTPDPNLSRIDGPSAQRGTECYRFPPPRSVVVPPSPGRKNYIQPGEGERVVAMTPAPRSNSRSSSPAASPGIGGWKLPWTSSAPSSPKIASPRPLPAAELARTTSSQSARSVAPRGSPMLRVPTPDSVRSMGSSPGFGPRRVKERKRYRNPSSLWSGSMSVLGCELYSLPTPLFKRFIAWSIETLGEEPIPRVPLRGGMAVPDLQSHGAPEVKVAKMENYRIMATWHPDASIRFWDISPHLLLLPTPLRFEYPGPLPHLTISLGTVLEQDELRHLPLAKLWKSDRSRVKIASVHLAREALECTITLQTGEVIVTKFQEAKGEGDDGDEDDQGYFPKVPLPSSQEEEGWVEEVTEVGHLAKTSTDGFRPVAIITLKRGEVTRCAISDIGFIAIAFASNSLAIVDMRGPDVILREGFDSEGVTMKKKQKKGNVQNVPGEASPVGSMKWVVAGLGADSTPRPRLIVSYVKGMTKIYTLVNVLGEWLVESKPPTFTNDSLANPVASFVIHPDSGNELVPSAEALSSAMQPSSPEHKGKDVPPHCLWIAVSRKSIRVAVNFNGDKVGKVEMDEELSEAFYITRHGKKVLVVITNRGTALFYSLPFLEFVTRLDLFFGHNPRPIGRISMDDRSGDFIEHSSPLDINLRTLFHFRKPFPPRIDPCAVKHAVPAQPQPLSASYLGWIWGAGPLTGPQLDTIVAGPARPPPPPPPPAPRKPLISWGDPPPPKQAPKPESPTPLTTIPKRTAVTKTKNPIQDAREREDAYSEMRRAAEERGNFLDNLGDSINNVHVSAGNYLSSARNAAMKEAAKSTAKGVFGKLL